MANKSIIRLRMSSHDAHYGGNLVDGARMLKAKSFLKATLHARWFSKPAKLSYHVQISLLLLVMFLRNLS